MVHFHVCTRGGRLLYIAENACYINAQVHLITAYERKLYQKGRFFLPGASMAALGCHARLQHCAADESRGQVQGWRRNTLHTSTSSPSSTLKAHLSPKTRPCGKLSRFQPLQAATASPPASPRSSPGTQNSVASRYQFLMTHGCTMTATVEAQPSGACQVNIHVRGIETEHPCMLHWYAISSRLIGSQSLIGCDR